MNTSQDIIPEENIEAVRIALDNPLNLPLNREEVSYSLRKMNTHSAPASSDKILPIMLKKGGKTLEAALLDTYDTCWIHGVYPQIWRSREKTAYTCPRQTNCHTTPPKLIEVSRWSATCARHMSALAATDCTAL